MNNNRLENKKSPSASEASDGAGHPGQRQLAIKDQDDPQASVNSRVCASCELNLRLREWDQQTADFKAANPDYATAQGVKRDLKRQTRAPYGTRKRSTLPRRKRSSKEATVSVMASLAKRK